MPMATMSFPMANETTDKNDAGPLYGYQLYLIKCEVMMNIKGLTE